MKEFGIPAKFYGWRTRLAIAILGFGCRHLEGTICPHRQYLYDRWQRGYGAGFEAGRRNAEAKWAGSITGTGPYANYPAPRTHTARVQ